MAAEADKKNRNGPLQTALNRPFALADQQKKDADHIYSVDREDPSRIVYYPTGRPGAGTEGYNSPVTALGSKASLPPGWTPSGKD